MIKFKHRKLSAILIVFLLGAMMFSMLQSAQATITVPVGTYFSMPFYGTNLNFVSEQVFNDVWRESSTNTSYPEYWMFTDTSNYIYGLQSSTVSFTVSTVLSTSSLALTYNQSGSGTVNLYCGAYGQPTGYNSSTLSYNPTTKIASAFYSSAAAITLTWSAAPTPTPSYTPAPTATPTSTPLPTATPAPAFTLTIIQPFNRTYVTSSIPVQLAVTGVGTSAWFNIKNGSSWIYGANQTYTTALTLANYAVGTYIFYAWAMDSFGNSTSAIVSFSVESITNMALPQVNTDAYWIFLYEGDFLGMVQAELVTSFLSFEAAIAFIVFMFMLPIYLRTKSLLLLSILWILIGSFFIAAVPLASGIAVLFIILGVGGLLWRLARGSSPY